MTEGQAWWIIVELGIIALVYVLTFVMARQRPRP